MPVNPKVDHFLIAGCGRCPLGGTPDCKVHLWTEALIHLRRIALDTGLTEELKWGFPCYTFEKHNVMMLAVFKEYCSISFFKGTLLKDTKGILSKPGENSQAVRLIRFTDAKQVIKLEPVIKTYITQAIELEKQGARVEFKERPEPIPEELQGKLDEDALFKAAFAALTPGRQRGYILYFSQPKQSKTRITRIEKYKEQILNGLGFHD